MITIRSKTVATKNKKTISPWKFDANKAIYFAITWDGRLGSGVETIAFIKPRLRRTTPRLARKTQRCERRTFFHASA